MKNFSTQLKECINNGTAEVMTLKIPENIIPRPNKQGVKVFCLTKVHFCNKYMKRCSSIVCKKERGFN